MKDEGGVDRREFVKQSSWTMAAAGVASALPATFTAKSYAQVLGANERVQLGLIGFGLIGHVHVDTFLQLPQARLAAVADTYGPRRAACQALVPDIRPYADFRQVLDDPAIDAVIVATPDHWHALQTMMACAAGKDVLVEKPLHLFVREGEWMQQVAEQHRRVVQVGTQQRSGPLYQQAKELLRGGAIGEIVSVQCNFLRNIFPGIGQPADEDPPADLDWELFLGPAPQRPYNKNRGIYHFRWFWDTAGGQMTNLGHHSLDIIHWVFDLPAPRTVVSYGGRRFLSDNGETPDIQDVILEYDRFPVSVQIREAAAGVKPPASSLVFLGTKGTMRLGRDGFDIMPDKKVAPENTFAAIIGGHPIGGPQPVAEPLGQFWCEPRSEKWRDARQLYKLHAQNFLDCIKSRSTPTSDLASSHQVSTACHLANIALRTGRQLRWDAQTRQILNDVEANAMLERPYRAPWDGVLRGLLG